MGKSEDIVEFISGAGGIASSSQIVEAGFLRGSIAYALESGSIDKLTRGVYCLPEIFDDEYAAISYRWRRCVFSHASALYLAGLSDRVPPAIDVSVPYGYNPRGLIREFSGARVHHVSPYLYELGVSEVRSSGGGMVRAYCAERAVADLIEQRVSGRVDPQLVHDAVGGYFKCRERDLPKLARMCSARGVEREFRLYLEVLA